MNIGKKHFYLVFFLGFLCNNIFAQYNDPNFSKPVTGYGSDGTHPVGLISFSNPAYPEKNIEIYYPSDIVGKVPTIFYSHAYGGNVSRNIIGMLDFVAKKGYAIVFVPYQTTNVTVLERYDNLLNGFRKAARDFPSIIDTTRVGFMGHSFGGGASFALSDSCIRENNWGSNGRFIYALAQWYSYRITQEQLANFPPNTNLLVEIFDDDTTNDHRMAIDVFNNISIPDENKDFLLLKSDTINGYIYAADHVVPNTASAFDALDYYAYYRLIDALCDYTFNGNLNGKNVALGNGSIEQITMPAGLKSLVETDHPLAKYPEDNYLFPCYDTENPRKEHCSATTELNDFVYKKKEITVFVDQSHQNLTVEIPEVKSNQAIYILSSDGKRVLKKQFAEAKININISSLSSGLYLVVCGNAQSKFTKR